MESKEEKEVVQMDKSTIIVAAITATPSVIAGVAAIISAIRNNVKKELKDIREDVKNLDEKCSVTQEASFFSLQAHVENGANGDVKKAYERQREYIFGKMHSNSGD